MNSIVSKEEPSPTIKKASKENSLEPDKEPPPNPLAKLFAFKA